MKSGDKYVLHTGGADYQLDDQTPASKFDGKDVKVTGEVDQTSNTIRVQPVELASSIVRISNLRTRQKGANDRALLIVCTLICSCERRIRLTGKHLPQNKSDLIIPLP